QAAEDRPAGRAPDQLPGGRPDHAERDGRRESRLPGQLVRALAVLLALPAACQNQPQPGANVLPPARAAEAPPPRTDLQTAEDAVRRQLNDPPGLSFANGAVWRDG